MSCPKDVFGKPSCYILEHPDHPKERFCTNCKKRFVEVEKEESSQESVWVVIVLVVIVLVLLLSACEKSTNSLLIRPVKDGDSALTTTE